MGLIERLQRVDERLGLDSAEKHAEREARRSALESLPADRRRSLTRRRVVAAVLLVATVLVVGLVVASLFPPSGDAWPVVTAVLVFVATLVGYGVGRRIERDVLAEHALGPDGEQ